MRHLDLIDNFVGLDKLGDLESIREQLALKEPDQILEFSLTASECLPAPTMATSDFHFIADSAQSGLPYPCRLQGCRQKKLTELIGYSSIYADAISLVDPFSFLLDNHSRDSAYLAEECAYAISNILLASPLINRGMLGFYPFSSPKICPNCFARAIASYDESGDAPEITVAVLNQLLHDTSVYVVESEDGYFFKIDGDDDVIEHTSLYLGPFDPSEAGISTVNIPYELPKNEVIRLQILSQMTKFVTNDIVQKAFLTSTCNASKVFSSVTEIKTLSRMLGGSFAAKQFNAEVPFLSSRNVQSILKLRDQEWHHFEEFRLYLEDASKEAALSAHHQANLDREIKSQLIGVEKAFRSYSKQATRDLIDGAAIGLASLSGSILTAGVSTFLSAAAALIGSGHFSKSMVPAIRKKFDEPESIRDSKVYYLWKVKRSLT